MLDEDAVEAEYKPREAVTDEVGEEAGEEEDDPDGKKEPTSDPLDGF